MSSSASSSTTVYYNDSHRLFLQYILSKKIVLESDAKLIYAEVCNVTGIPQQAEFPMFISILNKELDTLDYALRLSRDERTGETYLTMVNTNQDSATELATTFTATEIAYIRELYDAIIKADHEDYGISTMTAVRLGNSMQPTKLQNKEAQSVLDRLLEDRWIGENDGAYYLATRSIAELQDYFKQQFGDHVLECTFCFDMVTMGERCSNDRCGVQMHKYCADSSFNNSVSPKCPTCAHPWSRSNVFGLGLRSDY